MVVAKSFAFLVLCVIHLQVFGSEPVRFETVMPPLPGDGRPTIEDPGIAELRERPISQCGSAKLHPADTGKLTLLTRCVSAQKVDGKVQIVVEVVNPTSVRLTQVDVIVGFYPSRGPPLPQAKGPARWWDRT